jgi:hypothetical protein
MSRNLSGGRRALTGAGQVDLAIVLRMRFFDNWWEYLAPAVRLAPIIIAVLAVVVMRPMGYYWE